MPRRMRLTQLRAFLALLCELLAPCFLYGVRRGHHQQLGVGFTRKIDHFRTILWIVSLNEQRTPFTGPTIAAREALMFSNVGNTDANRERVLNLKYWPLEEIAKV